MKQIVLAKPALRSDYDIEEIVIENESWEEVLDYCESILDNHFLDNGWEGELTIKLKFKNQPTKTDGGE